ncbi:hypothetical protein K491DRAFT_753910 [Lophiostoma macrostomum CBS 122681]|uniref:Rhodopsin domain-containing protein n=1 Tax=Lophiostoma macrostomum CBS 122681 TaxID=1314788 RepID=A0A6A6TP74_9PLEO|nr:hypothetical protein K491DRAFT_753910 [Lophiostoma macrostomum CBS 122681]
MQSLHTYQLIYSPMVSPIKCSILYLYIRLFGSRPSVRWACYAQIVLVIVWGLVTFFLFVFQCTPIEVAWSVDRAEGTCFQYAPLFIGTNTVNVVMDFGLLVTPIPSIWQLKMAPTKKAWVTGILMFGACESIFSATRLGVLSQLSFIDVTWDHADALIWSTLETAVGVICACVPVLRPLLPRSSNPTTKGSRPTDIRYGNGSVGPNKAYAKFGETSTAPRDTDSASDEHELVTRKTLNMPTPALTPFHIHRTVDWDVSSEKDRRQERESGDDSESVRALDVATLV